MNHALIMTAAIAVPLTVPAAIWARVRVGISFLWRHGYWPRLAQPRNYNEWVQWRKLNDRDAGLARLTDKLHAKALAIERIGADAVIPTLWQGHTLPGEAPWPMPFIVKSNHGCKQFRVVRTKADWEAARRAAPKWLERPYGLWLDEWHYQLATRILLVEPFIGPADGLPIDYKVFVFHGVARFVQVHLGRGSNHRWAQFTRDWELLSTAHSGDVIEPPTTLEQMLAAAEAMAGGRDHLRVDFYEVNGTMWFGEACLFPGSGLERFDPESLDAVFGDCWSRGGPHSAASA